MAYCRNCGKEIFENADFCAFCGNKNTALSKSNQQDSDSHIIFIFATSLVLMIFFAFNALSSFVSFNLSFSDLVFWFLSIACFVTLLIMLILSIHAKNRFTQLQKKQDLSNSILIVSIVALVSISIRFIFILFRFISVLRLSYSEWRFNLWLNIFISLLLNLAYIGLVITLFVKARLYRAHICGQNIDNQKNYY